MRHHHPERPAYGRVQAAPDVEEPERHHPRHPGRHCLPYPDHHLIDPPGREVLEEAHHHRPSCLWRRLPRCGDRGRRARQGQAHLRRRRRQGRGTPRPRIQGSRRPRSHAQHGQIHPQLRTFLLPVCPEPQAEHLVRHQGHHLQEIRRPLQGHLRGSVPGVQRPLRRGRHRVLLHPYRRRSRARDAQRGRLHLGLQELRRRRHVRHGLHRIRFPGHDDLRARQPGRQVRV